MRKEKSDNYPDKEEWGAPGGWGPVGTSIAAVAPGRVNDPELA